jgi:hypothetical protein
LRKTVADGHIGRGRAMRKVKPPPRQAAREPNFPAVPNQRERTMKRELARVAIGLLFLAGVILVLLVLLVAEINFMKYRGRPSLVLSWLIASVLAVGVSAAAAIVYRVYHSARGRRDRPDGIPCVACGRRAFPVEGTIQNYRCGICRCRFAGPEHFG